MIRFLKMTKVSNNEILELKQIVTAFIDGKTINEPGLEGVALKAVERNGDLDCTAIFSNAAGYSRRQINSTANHALKDSGPEKLGFGYSFSDLSIPDVVVWDDSKPYQLNASGLVPKVIDGGPIKFEA